MFQLPAPADSEEQEFVAVGETVILLQPPLPIIVCVYDIVFCFKRGITRCVCVTARNGAASVAGRGAQTTRANAKSVHSCVPSIAVSVYCRRRDCHFDDTPCLSLLKNIRKVQGMPCIK